MFRLSGLLWLMLGAWPAFAVDDPTAPPRAAGIIASSSSNRVQAHRLQSILIGAQRRVAVVDGFAMTVGQSRGGLTMVAIEAGSVTIQTRQGRQRLYLTHLDKQTLQGQP